MSSSKETERLARRAAIEAMTAELMGTDPMTMYKKVEITQPMKKEIIESISIANDDMVVESEVKSIHRSLSSNSNSSKSQNSSNVSTFIDKSWPSSSSSYSKEERNQESYNTLNISNASNTFSSSSSTTVNEKETIVAKDGEVVDIDEYAFRMKIPVSHQADLTGHSKAITALSVDSSGNRVVSGSLDYQIKIYDFGGMDSRFRAFKSFEPSDGHPITSLCHSPQSDRFIIGTGSCQPKVFDRDGNLIITFVRGDMYIRDMTNTKGHTMEVTGVYWHPTQPETVVTSSLDGTVRIWDLLGEAVFGNLVNKHVLKIRSMSAAATTQTRIGATCCYVSSNGKYYVAGASDGTIHLWQEKKVYSRPDIVIKSAHGIGNSVSTITSVLITKDCSTLISRGDDEMIKVWNIKKPTAPLKVFMGYPNLYPMANIALSADEKILVCGVGQSSNSSKSSSSSSSSTEKQSTNEETISSSSSLCFFDLSSSNTLPSMQIGVPSCGSIIYIKWPSATNQIICGTSSGTIRVFYDPRLSKKGVLISSAKPAKREKEPSDFAVVGEIINPHALPMFRTDPRNQHKRLREAKDATVPERPKSSGPGSRLNTSFFFTNYVTSGKEKNTLRDEDPREALLRMDAAAKSDPLFLGKAYKETQPKPLLAPITFEEEQEEFKRRQQQLN